MSNPDDIYDELLVLRCQGGDRNAMGILVERWHPRLLRFAKRVLGDVSAAEDVVQASWVEAVKRIGSINDPRSFRSWMFRVVANKCTDTIRRSARRRQAEVSSETAEIEDEHADQGSVRLFGREQVIQLRQAVELLGREDRELVRLFYLDGQSVRQIAQQITVPEGTVKSRLHHVRCKLKRHLKGDPSWIS